MEGAGVTLTLSDDLPVPVRWFYQAEKRDTTERWRLSDFSAEVIGGPEPHINACQEIGRHW
jgi:hypothetical protein